MTDTASQPPGWYHAHGDLPGTQRYWNGTQWEGGPQPIPGASGADANRRAMVGGVAIAPAGKRVLARLIDWALWLAVAFAGGAIVAAVSDVSVDGGATPSTGLALLVVIGFVGVLTLYEVVMVAVLGGTIGKLVVGIRVRNENGGPVGVATALIRFAPFLALVMVQRIPIVGGIGTIGIVVAATVALTMLFADTRLQVPWDKLAKTLVLEADVDKSVVKG